MRRLAVIAFAAAMAFVPIPRDLVERYYSRGLYPQIQQALTSFSNVTPAALFDWFLLASAGLLLVLLVRRGRVRTVLTLAAVGWLVFLLAWGMNYRRLPLEAQLAFDERRLTQTRVAELAREAVREMNRLYRDARPADLSMEQRADALVPAMMRAAADLKIAPPVPARPKATWLSAYFTRAGIDGMTDPFFLETLLVSDLLPVEQPAAIAHEWGHLAGFANEAEASFFAWLTCLRGDPAARYSGWVALYPHLLGALGAETRKTVHARLGPGPREDFRRIGERLARANPSVQRVATVTYDRFLRVNRVAEGIESYDAVVRLVAGTTFRPAYVPELR